MHPEIFIELVKKRCEEKNITFNGLTQFQKDCSSVSDNVIAVAPTASGKQRLLCYGRLIIFSRMETEK